MRNIKDYREKELKWLMTLYIILMLLLSTSIIKDLSLIGIESFTYANIAELVEFSAVSGVISLLVVICDSLLSTNTKDKLVGLLFLKKPGETIFSDIDNNKVKDDRFSKDEAKLKYKSIIENIPENESCEYENSNWYRIYQKHKDDDAIKQTQKDSLVCRDLFVQTLLFIPSYLLLLLIDGVTFSWKFLVLLILFAVLTNIAARNKRRRFVLTVISVDVSKYQENLDEEEENVPED